MGVCRSCLEVKLLVDQLDDVGNVVDVVGDLGDVVSDVLGDVVSDVEEDVGNVCAADDACHADDVTGAFVKMM